MVRKVVADYLGLRKLGWLAVVTIGVIGSARVHAQAPATPFLAPDVAAPVEVKKDIVFKPVWKDGLSFETEDKRFRIFIAGRTQVDAAWMIATKDVQFAPGGIGKLDDAVNFRRARLDVGGTMFRTIDFLSEFDFINTVTTTRAINTPAPTDLWVTFTDLPYVGNLRIGNQKHGLSFEHLTSSRFLNFLERSFGFDAFVEDQNNGFKPGLALFNTAFDERMTWHVGVYKHNRNVFGWDTGDGEGEFTGRLTCLPVYRDEGRTLVHLGIGASHADLDDHVARYRARTMVRNGPAVLHTVLAEANVVGRNQQVVVPELAIIHGPWSMQAEYFCTWVHGAAIPVAGPPRVDLGTLFFHAFTIEAHVFLTGEHRPYRRKSGALDRVVPLRNAAWGSKPDESHGPGAWQLAVRYQFIDMNDKALEGGLLHDFTGGLNWFLNPNMKMQFNYSATHRDAVGTLADGWIHSLGTRLAVDF